MKPGCRKQRNLLDRDNARVEQLTSALSKATGAKASSLDDQLEEAKVQVQLDQDEVDNAKQELAIAGGDTQGRIEQLMKEHDEASPSQTRRLLILPPRPSRRAGSPLPAMVRVA